LDITDGHLLDILYLSH